jgi:CBS domain-containing protein
MGDHNVIAAQEPEALRRFTRQLLQDVRALEYLLQEGAFEAGARRIGAEQELFLVDDHFNPAPVVERVMARNTDPRVVTELTKFNLEFNLDPAEFGGAALSRMEAQLVETLARTRETVRAEGADVVMCGILPTIHLSDLTLDNLTPMPRYYALDDAIQRLRGGPGQIQIRGTDELFVRHDGMMMEGCNTSFQTHFQVDPDNFAAYYNIAQVVAAPVLAAGCNSPLLFGKDLWRETRIALFQQAVDTRSANLYLREMSPRVHFGTRWVKESVTEIYKEDVSRFRVILAPDTDEDDPFEVIARGEMPRLRALMLHNGTVYRWNRAIYGFSGGKPHLRIENRILPAGPTPADEIANAAFWYGLVAGLMVQVEDVTRHIRFDEARANFVSAARQGLGATFTWLNGERRSATQLILEKLIPLAHQGLEAAGIEAADRDHYLGIMEARVAHGQNGAEWQVASLMKMREESPSSTRAERLAALVGAMIEHQDTNAPVHTWPLARIAQARRRRRLERTRVEHFMATDLYTVHEDELVDLVACLMDWQRIRHVLVEDEAHRLVGLVSHRSLLRYLVNSPLGMEARRVPVSEIMVRDVVTVTPETRTEEAIRLMRTHGVGALPVVRDGYLAGIITERDFIEIAGEILAREAGETAPGGRGQPSNV